MQGRKSLPSKKRWREKEREGETERREEKSEAWRKRKEGERLDRVSRKWGWSKGNDLHGNGKEGGREEGELPSCEGNIWGQRWKLIDWLRVWPVVKGTLTLYCSVSSA